MLSELQVKNFAIIDELRVSFGEGLNVISGETGAGKSIIIGAIGMLLGDRASSDMIRSSEEIATIEASFNITEDNHIRDKLREMDFSVDDELVIKRTISRTGKNKVYINGNMANLAILSSLSESLINICSQHEHQVILNKENHIEILDDYGGLRELRNSYEILYRHYLTSVAQLQELEKLRDRYREDDDLRRFQLQEINNANLMENEEESLQDEKKLIINAQKLVQSAEGAYEVLYSKEGSILEGLRNMMTDIREIKKIDEKSTLNAQLIENICYQLEDVAMVLRNYGKGMDYDQHRLDAIEERIEYIRHLKRKYGGSIKAIIQKRDDLDNDLNNINAVQKDIELLMNQIEVDESELSEQALKLSKKRKDAAINLAADIESEMKTLKMESASFRAEFKQAIDTACVYHLKGIDDIEFFLSTNTGEPLKPLARIASGGELSRIVLSMKKVLASSGQVGTIIFDEVDSGIGGATAEIVGEKLKEVSAKYQVLCITHLPQIACFASHHFRVSKEEKEKRTNTFINLLSDEERLDEITRMLTGIEITDTAREHAKEMLNASRN